MLYKLFVLYFLLINLASASTPLISSDEQPKLKPTVYALPLIPHEIVYELILPYSNNKKVHHINRQFFTWFTRYKHQDMFLTGLDHKPTEQRYGRLNRVYGKINFRLFYDEKRTVKKIPSYIWYSVVNKVSFIPERFWLHLIDSSIENLQIMCPDVRTDSDVKNLQELSVILGQTNVNNLTLYQVDSDHPQYTDNLNYLLRNSWIKDLTLSFALTKINDRSLKNTAKALEKTNVIHLIIITCSDSTIGKENLTTVFDSTRVKSIHLQSHYNVDIRIRNPEWLPPQLR